MIDILSKPAEQINPHDIQSLIDLEVPESDRIEYKESLSTKKQKVDPWMQGMDKIGKDARNSILKEVVAFANAYGGVLVLGIADSDAEPPVASKVTPVPRCAKLAAHLRLVFRDCVDPQLVRIEVFAVPIEGEQGVVVVRVGQSRLAPHRVKPTLSCPIRRADRSEEMSMRQIQDLTLNLARGQERIDRRRTERSTKFQQEFQYLKDPKMAVGIRATAIPLGDEVWFDGVYKNRKILESLDEPWRTVYFCQDGREPHQLFPRVWSPDIWRPILRGARAEPGSNPAATGHGHNIYREIYCDGLIEAGCVYDRDFSKPSDIYLPPDLPVVLLANLLTVAICVKNQAGAPSSEYAIDFEISIRGVTPYVGVPEPEYWGIDKNVAPGQWKFPLYSLVDSEDVGFQMRQFYRDFYNSLSTDVDTDNCWFEIENWPNREVD